MYNKNYISVGIDVGSAFSFMTIVAPDGSVIQKPFKITHNKPDSLEKAVSAIKKAEELHSLRNRHLSGIHWDLTSRSLLPC